MSEKPLSEGKWPEKIKGLLLTSAKDYEARGWNACHDAFMKVINALPESMCGCNEFDGYCQNHRALLSKPLSIEDIYHIINNTKCRVFDEKTEFGVLHNKGIYDLTKYSQAEAIYNALLSNVKSSSQEWFDKGCPVGSKGMVEKELNDYQITNLKSMLIAISKLSLLSQVFDTGDWFWEIIALPEVEYKPNYTPEQLIKRYLKSLQYAPKEGSSGDELMLKAVAMNIVNQLFDLCKVDVPFRQANNDKADRFVVDLMRDKFSSAKLVPLNHAALQEVIFPYSKSAFDIASAICDKFGSTQPSRTLNDEEIDSAVFKVMLSNMAEYGNLPDYYVKQICRKAIHYLLINKEQ